MTRPHARQTSLARRTHNPVSSGHWPSKTLASRPAARYARGMAQSHTAIYDQLVAHTRETILLSSVKSTLEWDEQTYMPTAAAPYRAEQDALLTGMIHARRTDRCIGDWLNELLASPLAADRHSESGATIHDLKREYDRLVKLPQALVEQLARARLMGHQAWLSARADNNFAEFQPMLERIIRLKREEADAIGYRDCRYDALLDHYEPGASTEHVAEVLAALRQRLAPLVAQDRSESPAAKNRNPRAKLSGRGPAAIRRNGRGANWIRLSNAVGLISRFIHSIRKSARTIAG